MMLGNPVTALAMYAPHYLPLLRLRDTQVGLGWLVQAAATIESPTELDHTGRWIAIISDDAGPEGYAKGPSGFDHDKLTWILGRCTSLAIYSAGGEARFYAHFVRLAMSGGRVAVVETQTAYHDAWVAHATKYTNASVLEISSAINRAHLSGKCIDKPSREAMLRGK